MIFRSLVSITFVVMGSAQVSRTACRVCSPDQAIQTDTAVLRVTGLPITTIRPELAAAKAHGKAIVMIIIPTGTAASDISEFLSYIFAEGKVKSQTWQAPAISDVVLLRHVSLADPTPAGWGTDDSDSRSTVSVPIPISDVTGLAGALSNINNSILNLSSSAASLNTQVSTLTSIVQSLPPLPAFVDSEVPVGIVDGSNTTFTLSRVPLPQSSVVLVKNGMKLSQGSDYSMSGQTIVFATGAIPRLGDTLEAAYRQ